MATEIERKFLVAGDFLPEAVSKTRIVQGYICSAKGRTVRIRIRSLLSAIPMPNPRLERKKKLLVYDPAMHDYTAEPPQWQELRPNHFVLCNAAEAAQWIREL